MYINIVGINSLINPDIEGKQAEAIAASYARCSRSPLSLEEIRKEAIEDVISARKSNKRIVFDMGHSSIAEHVVLNIDMIGISRFATEFIQSCRLSSFTERSQRYLHFKKPPSLPFEMSFNSEKKHRFKEISQLSSSLYTDLVKKLPKKNCSLGDPSKEDARYALLMSTPTQLGVTLNARSLETMIKKLYSIPLHETKEIAEKLEKKAKKIIPSLVKHTEANSLEKPPIPKNYPSSVIQNAVRLLDYTKNPDIMIAAGLLSEKHGISFSPDDLTASTAKKILLHQLKQLTIHDSVSRAFELAVFTFEVILSASAYAQLKRHRMATILPGFLDPSLGVEIPPSFVNTGMDKVFINYSNMLKEAWQEDGGKISSSYLLCNANRRRVIISFNMREFYHISRLRMDKHAQWEIRKLVMVFLDKISQIAPLSSVLCGGKDDFDKKHGFL